jgi:ABC-2 type transport system ATP-binding protein
LIGQQVAASGRIQVLEMDTQDPRLRARIAYMPQSFGQYLDLSVQENLEFFAALHGLRGNDAAAQITDLIARAGLRGFEGRRAGQLSGGMMQKLALACALVSRPEVMFLDEPTTGVDPISRRAFWQLLDSVRAEGVAIVYATANMDEAERCDRVGLLIDGRFARQGPPLDLIRAIDAPLYELKGAGARARRHAVRELPGVQLVFPVGETLKVWLRGTADATPFRDAVAQLAVPMSAQPLRPSLHDIALRDLALSAERGDG